MKCNRRVLAIVLLSGLAWISQGAYAQQAPTQSADAPLPTIKAETRLVLVDTVVTDKKGNYIRDLTSKDFKVWEDNKEQPIKSFSFESDANAPANDQKRYLVLFFDNSTMNISDQGQARAAALKFLDSNTGANRYIAVVDFGGAVRITQNFTTDAERLKQVVKNLKFSAVSPNVETPVSQPVPALSTGIPQLGSAQADFAARTLLLALRNLAKGMANVPGRKTLVLFSSGFPMNPADPNTVERESELTAAVDACNKANVAIYPIDARGLTTPLGAAPEWQIFPDAPEAKLVSATLILDPQHDGDEYAAAHLVYVQRGGSGSTGGSGGSGGGGGHAGAGGAGSTGGAGSGGAHGGTGSTGSGGSRTGSGGGSRGVGGSTTTNPLPVAPYSQSRQLLPTITDVSNNQQVLYELAVGTGGFVIVNTNDLLGGLEKIAQEQNQYYVVGYTPPESEEGTCHTLKVKVDRGGTVVRSRSGYCNVRPTNLLAGKPIEKQLENQATGSQPGNINATMLAPYFYTSGDTARVNLVIEIPSASIKFEKQKGKQRAEVNVIGLAYKPDGTVGARFSDKVELTFDDKDAVGQFQKKPYHYENQFEIGPGHYELKVAFSSSGESFGKLQMPLVVDSYDAKQFNMSAVALSRELHPLNQMSESLDAAMLEDKTPLVAQGMQIIPSGNDIFKKSDMAVFYVEIYDPLLAGANPPKVGIQMRVVDRKTGEKKVDTGGPVPGAKEGTSVVALGLRLPVDKLPPGSYRLELRSGDSAGNSSPARTADFEVE